MTTLTLSRGTLASIHTALGVLGNRKLPTVNSDLRVARLLRAIASTTETNAAARQKIVGRMLEGVVIASLTQAHAQLLAQSISGEQAAFDAELDTIEVPDVKLTKADLPKETSGDDGWKNAAQLGALVADLNALYELDDES